MGQSDYLNSVDLNDYVQSPIFQDSASFFKVNLFKDKKRIDKSVTVSLYGDKIVVKGKKIDVAYSFANVSAVTVLGRNKVNVYIGDDCYQIKGGKRMNGLKFVHFFHRYKNMQGGEGCEFLGL